MSDLERVNCVYGDKSYLWCPKVGWLFADKEVFECVCEELGAFVGSKLGNVSGPVRWRWLLRVGEIEDEDGIEVLSAAVMCLWGNMNGGNVVASWVINGELELACPFSVVCLMEVGDELLEISPVKVKFGALSIEIANKEDGVEAMCAVGDVRLRVCND